MGFDDVETAPVLFTPPAEIFAIFQRQRLVAQDHAPGRFDHLVDRDPGRCSG